MPDRRLVFATLLLLPGSLGGQPIPQPLGAAEMAWRIRDLAGREVALEAYRGRVVVLNLWATWCVACVREMPTLEALQEAVAGDGVVVLAVSPEAPGPVARFARRHRLRLAPWVEATPLPARLGVVALPTTLVIDPEGTVVLRHRGAADWNTPPIREWLRALAASGATRGGR